MRPRFPFPMLLTAGLILGSALGTVALGSSAWAQETIDQFNAANAENRRHAAAESQLRNDALRLRQDQARGLLQCQGAGAVGACQGNLQLQTQQRGLMLSDRIRQERDIHHQNLQGIGVSPLQ